MSWIDRVVEFPNRFKLTPVSGQDNTYDLEPKEGNVLVEGTLLNAQNMTDETNALIDAKIEAYKETVPQWRFLGTRNGNEPLYLPDDDSWTEVFVKGVFNHDRWAFEWSFPRTSLVADGAQGCTYMKGSYGGSTDWHMVLFDANTSFVKIRQWLYRGENWSSVCYINVYVR